MGLSLLDPTAAMLRLPIHPLFALLGLSTLLLTLALVSGYAWGCIPVLVLTVFVLRFVDPRVHLSHPRFQPGRPLFHTLSSSRQCQDDWYASISGPSGGDTLDVALMIRKSGGLYPEHQGAYVLVIDYLARVTYYYRYGLDEVQVPAEQGVGHDFRVRVGENLFSNDRIELSLPRQRYCGTWLGADENHKLLERAGGVPELLELELEFEGKGPNHPYNWLQQSIMGFATLIPFNTFFPDILISNARVRGRSSGLSRVLELDAGEHRVYMERYHGTGFPRSWLWGGAQQWDDPDTEVSFVYGIVYEKGKMPGAGWSFGLQLGERFFSFSPGHFGRLHEFRFDELDGVRRINASASDSRGYQLHFECRGCSEEEELEIWGVQDHGFTLGPIADHGCAGSIDLKLEDPSGELIWEGRSRNPAFEFNGDYQAVYAKLREVLD